MNIAVLSQDALNTISARITRLKSRYDREVEEIRRDRLYTGEEVCKLIGISIGTLYNRRNQGRIGFVRIRKKILYRYADFCHEIRNREVPKWN